MKFRIPTEIYIHMALMIDDVKDLYNFAEAVWYNYNNYPLCIKRQILIKNSDTIVTKFLNDTSVVIEYTYDTFKLPSVPLMLRSSQMYGLMGVERSASSEDFVTVHEILRSIHETKSKVCRCLKDNNGEYCTWHLTHWLFKLYDIIIHRYVNHQHERDISEPLTSICKALHSLDVAGLRTGEGDMDAFVYGLRYYITFEPNGIMRIGAGPRPSS